MSWICLHPYWCAWTAHSIGFARARLIVIMNSHIGFLKTCISPPFAEREYYLWQHQVAALISSCFDYLAFVMQQLNYQEQRQEQRQVSSRHPLLCLCWVLTCVPQLSQPEVPGFLLLM